MGEKSQETQRLLKSTEIFPVKGKIIAQKGLVAIVHS